MRGIKKNVEISGSATLHLVLFLLSYESTIVKGVQC